MTDAKIAYPLIEPRRRQPSETIKTSGRETRPTLEDYWAWSSSDLVNNVQRGVFAEYLVALALDQASGVREPWAAYDVKTSDGVTVEVKSASYLQQWAQKLLSQISFGIAPSTRWDPQTNCLVGLRQRQADVYVFCLLAHKDQDTLDPLDLAQWKFYVLRTEALDAKSLHQKKIALSSLRKLGAEEVPHDGIRECVSRLSVARK